jgi:hypothetical protein
MNSGDRVAGARLPQLRRTPETRTGPDEFDSDAGFALRPASDMDDATLLLSLIGGVCEKEALAARDDGLQSDQAAAFVNVDRDRFFVKRLLLGIRAVHQ